MLNNSNIHFVLILLLIIPSFVDAQTVANSTHNLSADGPGAVKAISGSETEICIFCHTPHVALPETPLWNTKKTAATFTLYNSSTLDATPGQPDGSSTLCLSCHDGTIALGHLLSRAEPIGMSGELSGNNLFNDLDLSDDHPISFIYDQALAEADQNLSDPTSWPQPYPIQLENGKMQCSSCHDAHNNIYGNFLATSLENSELCLNCHDQGYWNNSSHHTSTFDASSANPSPWLHIQSPYPQVGQNGCLNCHDAHGANQKFSLLKAASDENNCLDCHNGQGSNTDILSQLNKVSSGGKFHDVINSTGHSPSENIKATVHHVECQDCHNSHAANNSVATAPYVSGPILGVKGVNASDIPVNSIQYSYELCFRCHGSVSGRPPRRMNRYENLDNVILEFATTNTSTHGIVGPSTAVTGVPSLIPPWTVNSQLYCTDCHSSDGGDSPKGPHGSTYTPLLKYNYTTSDPTFNSASSYALCYSCHDQSVIISGNRSFKDHEIHLDESVPCAACHDAHGVAAPGGYSLVNFNSDYVGGADGVNPPFVIGNPSGGGSCGNIKCHNHTNKFGQITTHGSKTY